MTEFAQRIGLDTEEHAFYDVFGLDEVREGGRGPEGALSRDVEPHRGETCLSHRRGAMFIQRCALSMPCCALRFAA
jgi:hypothetical protein